MRGHLKNHFIPHEENDHKPHFIHDKTLIALSLCAVVLFGFAYTLNTFVIRNSDLFSAVITSVLVDITNLNRTNSNLHILETNSTLTVAAQKKADDMASKSYFAHTSSDGKSPWYWFKESGYDFVYAGENLAINFADSEEVVEAWMNSEGHRANILNGKFTEIGVAMASGVYNGKDTIFIVQLFGRPVPEQEVSNITTSLNLATVAEASTVVENDIEVNSIPPKSEVQGSSVVDKLITSPKTILRSVYIALGVILVLALIIFLVMKPKGKHTKTAFYVLSVIILIVWLLYLSSVWIFPEILVK